MAFLCQMVKTQHLSRFLLFVYDILNSELKTFPDIDNTIFIWHKLI